MKERRQVEIQGKDVRLIWKDEIKRAVGEADYVNCEITLERGHPDDRTISALLHEAIHILSDELELKLKHHTIGQLESGLYGFLKKSGVDMVPLIREPDGQEVAS